MTIQEMVDKSYASAKAMQAEMDIYNELNDQSGKVAYAHFGLEYVPFESPYLSREDFIETMAKNMLLLLLKKDEVEEQVDRYTIK